MSNEHNLKPCPFCGGTKLRIARAPYQVWCQTPNCKIRGLKLQDHPSMTDAITAWNTRHESDQLKAQVAKLEWLKSKIYQRAIRTLANPPDVDTETLIYICTDIEDFAKTQEATTDATNLS